MNKKFKNYLLVCLLSIFLVGCGLEFAAISLAPHILQAGAGVIAGLEDVDVKVGITPGIKNETIQKIKKVAVVVSSKEAGTPEGQNITHIMADNLELELMNLGFNVIERSNLDKVLSEQKLQQSGLIDTSTAAKIGRLLAVDAIILANVTASTQMDVSSGLVSSSVIQKTTISNATMKIVSIEKADVIMIVSLSYKKGQKPTEASKTMAIALNEKIKNPTGSTEASKK